jgi:tight adherence protein C
MSAVLLLGAGVGLGVLLLLRATSGRPPWLAGALRELGDPPAGDLDGRVRTVRQLRTWSTRGAHAADLAIVERTADQHAVRKLGAATLLAALPTAAAALAAVAGLGGPLSVVVVATIVLAAVGFVTPDVELRGVAAQRRAEFVHGLSSFLDVTAVLLAGGAGTESALHAAAALGDGWPQQQLRASLDRCRLTGQTPWQVLGELGDRLGVDELTQLATSLQLAGEQGARVRVTLTERARALRTAQLTAAEHRARAATEQMSVPVALLAVAFMLFVGFPAVWVVVGEL